MNNRIHKNDLTLIGRIADQAHEETVAQYNMRMKTEHPGDVIFYDMFNEKFAKLIVRECAGIYSKIDNGNEHMGTEDYLLALKKHFGVES